ncbi:MAG: hypothetical protein WD602_00255 [Actinomycetota bacterium]
MLLPIWVAARELDCCQPEATVGETWRIPMVDLRSADPWWAEDASEPVPQDVMSLGVVEMQAEVESTSFGGQSAIASVGPVRIVVPQGASEGLIPAKGRLWLDAHKYSDVRGAPGLELSGIVRRIRGIRLVYEPVTVYLAIPKRQEPPIDLNSTKARNDPEKDYGFAELLIDLEIQ